MRFFIATDYGMSSRPEISAQLIEDAKQSEEAFIVLYQHYVKRVFRFLLVKTGDREVAEDMTQETFITVFKKLDYYTSTGAPFSSWLFQIALNHARMHWRRQKPVEQLDNEMSAAVPSNHNSFQKEWMDFYFALRHLSEEDQNLLLMKYIDDMANREIAVVLNISANTCGVKIYRALKRLEKHL